MTGLFFKRAGAYIVDIIIVALVVSLLSFIPFLNPNRVLYSEKYNELVMVREQLDKNEISMEEYTQAYKPIAYEIYRLNLNYVVIDLVCVLFYFGIMQYFTDGQTIGKKLFQLRVVSKDDKPLTIMNFIIRSVVLSNLIISIALQGVVQFVSVENYYDLYNNINLVGSIITYIILFMVLVRVDGRGLHDFVANTKVISISEDEKEKEDKIIEEQKVLETEFEVKREKKIASSKKTTTTTKKSTKKS